MSPEHLLRAVRPIYILTSRAEQSASSERKFWSIKLDGLHRDHLKTSTTAFRDERKRPEACGSNDISLKLSSLRHGLAKALGATNFDAWDETEQRMVDFLLANGMTHPKDLLKWSNTYTPLSARQLSDRLFNSGLPLPKKIFTGVGSHMFAARGRGRIDISQLRGDTSSDEATIEWCEARANQTVLRLEREYDWSADTPDVLELSGRDLLLCALRFEFFLISFNLLGDNLVAPTQRAPELRLYAASDDQRAIDLHVFKIFREEIERSDAGWIEVVPLPWNDNIIFLKGTNGAFDWVVRDQRDDPFVGNPYHPILKHNELPTEMKASTFEAHLYFKTGEWHEQLAHCAEVRHYAEGGSAETWPGYAKLLMREFVATRRSYAPPSRLRGPSTEHFVPHRLEGYCLMVSPLVTIREFWQFLETSSWRSDRALRSHHHDAGLERDLDAVNLSDDGHLPASVTWFDALAFCRHYQDRTGLPVRLVEIDEWRQIAPPPTRNIEQDGWGDLIWVVEGGDSKPGGETIHRYPEACDGGGVLRFGKELIWKHNTEGLPFVSVVDFGEWLADYANGHASVANAATGQSLMTGSLERDPCPAHLTMRYKGLKVGFRLCYVAHPDA
ncbi:hypothetical protein K6W76_21320 [Burkholderia anthina]|uniref:hypothetical protein n=1 Tax=Burkholderia anthina TaxID=179879 RepID=UPI00158E95E3|nr:hypothetical protein [Burkholderia anthina]MBY4869021.1 hypothetical protein [Burkholderia anthina]